MARSFELGKMKLTKAVLKEPRVVIRAVLGVLLAANLIAAAIAFKPFGGSSEDMLREQAALGSQLATLELRVASSKNLVDRVEMARTEGERFLDKYLIDGRVAASTVGEELNRLAKDSGVRPSASSTSTEPIEGSDTLYEWSITANYEGDYPQLKKFVEMVDKSSRFLIIEQMNVTSPQQQAGQKVTVAVKMDAFTRQSPEDAQ
jgi:Tfp pilus assembly protein PilO